MTKTTSRRSDDPALDPRVRTVLDAAAAPVEPAGPLPGEDEALAAFRAAPQCTGKNTMLSRLVSAKAAAAAAIGTGVLLTGGIGAAAAGVLPGPAQQTVSTWLDTVGISVPTGEWPDENGDPGGSEQAPAEETGHSDGTPGERADENDDQRGHSDETPGEPAEPPPAADHGKLVSETAKNSTAEGADKGEEIAGIASDGHGQSGDHGSAEKPQGGKPADEDHGGPPVSAPNSGGSGNRPTGG